MNIYKWHALNQGEMNNVQLRYARVIIVTIVLPLILYSTIN